MRTCTWLKDQQRTSSVFRVQENVYFVDLWSAPNLSSSALCSQKIWVFRMISFRIFSGFFLTLLSDWQLDIQTQTCHCVVMKYSQASGECNRSDINQTRAQMVNPTVESSTSTSSTHDAMIVFSYKCVCACVCVCRQSGNSRLPLFMTIQSPSSLMHLLIPYTHTHTHTGGCN